MKTVPVSDRISILYADKGCLERSGHSLVLQQGSVETIFPVGVSAVIMLGPGTTVTHAAVALAASEGALLLWVGERGVRMYASGNPRGNPDSIVRQACAFADNGQRLQVARRIFRLMFNEYPPLRRSVEQLRGLEGVRVRAIYKTLAEQVGVEWQGRTDDLDDPVNAALAGVNAALYGLTEAVILALGYSPSIGFVHTGNARSFVFDVADTIKFQTAAPLAFELAKDGGSNMERRSRTAMRDFFFENKTAERLVDILNGLFDADSCF